MTAPEVEKEAAAASAPDPKSCLPARQSVGVTPPATQTPDSTAQQQQQQQQ